ncbi:alpha/beta hydrolase [Luteolibacter sp. Populi]|uniref:alpha/beta hydrolase n=1 Tax=Luteolibacter sp. Populi TaxID=3230487 RepID=UPI003467E01B
MRRWVKITGAAALLLGLGSCSLTTKLISEAIVHPTRKGVGAPLPEGMTARTFVLPDQVEIHTWEARPEGAPKAAVLVLHGISDSKASQVETLRYLARRGIVAMAPDLRAHGDSGGPFATYGFVEKNDLSLLRRVMENEFPGIKVGLWGTSYGGAVALQSMGVDDQFDFAIIESTFADLRDIARQQVMNHTSLPVSNLGPYMINEAGKLASFDPGEVSPEKSMERIKVPVLHMHGEDDEIIPISQGRRIASHAKDADYRFVPIAKGTHFGLKAGDPKKYDREVKAFLDRVVDGNP